MKTINLNTKENVKTFLFPDKQPHVNIENINEGDEVQVVCSIKNADLLCQILQVSNALDNLFAKKKELVIPYLMGARFDRLMQHGDSVDLKVIADMINYCEFEKVIILDPHSDISLLLIKNSIPVNNKFLVEHYYERENVILICPDSGATKKVNKYFDWNKDITDVVYCNKVRDLSNGAITLKVLEPEKCTDRNCVIIDDLCDGGGTFLAIAEQIKPKHLTLIVTHGIFSKGIKILTEKFDEIICSDSFCGDIIEEGLNIVKFS